MLSRLRATQCVPYFAALGRESQRRRISQDVVQQLEQSGARILRTAKKRAEKRVDLLTKVNPDTLSARKIKELEPIHNAWNEWMHTREVRSVSTLPHG